MKRRKIKYQIQPKLLNIIRDLIRELKYLKLVLQDILTKYTLKVNSTLLTLLAEIESVQKRKSSSKSFKEKTILKMLSMIRSLKIKPQKGRGKDLLRIEELLKKLSDLHESQ